MMHDVVVLAGGAALYQGAITAVALLRIVGGPASITPAQSRWVPVWVELARFGWMALATGAVLFGWWVGVHQVCR